MNNTKKLITTAFCAAFWLGTALTTALPGIAIQLVIISALLTALERSGAVSPERT